MFSKFWSDVGGNMAGIVAVASFVILGGTGMAIDISGANNLKSNYQDMADAAVLAAARSRDRQESAMASIADETVDYLNTTGTSPNVTTRLSDDERFITVTVSGQYDNFFMGIFGQEQVDVSSFAETVIEVTDNTEIVLVLDTTRSMNYQNRLVDLKRASNTFLDVIEGIETDDRVRISVVPFGQYVNIGTDQRGQPWLDVPADWIETFPTTCGMQRGPVTGQTCTPGLTPPRPGRPAQAAQPGRPAQFGTCTDDGVSYRCQTSPARPATPFRPAVPADPGGQPTTNCSNNYGPDVRVCSTPPPVRHEWHGCVGSRRNASNLDADYSNGEPQVPGFLDLRCGDTILPLTTDFAAVRRKINGLATHGETYTAAGLMWGYRMVTFNDPFPLTRMSPNGEPPRRIVIFMTDGFNTRSRSGELHNGTDRSEADDVSERICEQMHDERDFEVYSVSFRVTDSRARTLIRDCASEEDMFYDARNGTTLNAAFEDIAYSLLSPRLTQ